MRVVARIGWALAGLALASPAVAWGGMPEVPKPAKKGPVKKIAEKLCADCQRVKMLREKGLNVPPPPPLPLGAPVKGEKCTQCGRPTAVLAGKLPAPSRMLPGEAAGRASVGGAPMFAVNPGDPMPVGVMGPRVAAGVPAVAPGTRDMAVMPTSMAEPAVGLPHPNRPHVLTHLLGLDSIGNDRAEARERRKRESHASIPYGPVDQTVNEIPTSMVYGRRAPK
jgi:hypothetical protein